VPQRQVPSSRWSFARRAPAWWPSASTGYQLQLHLYLLLVVLCRVVLCLVALYQVHLCRCLLLVVLYPGVPCPGVLYQVGPWEADLCPSLLC
jgi:hypothetical protein